MISKLLTADNIGMMDTYPLAEFTYMPMFASCMVHCGQGWLLEFMARGKLSERSPHIEVFSKTLFGT